MAGLTVQGTVIRGIASAVPKATQSVEDLAKLFGPEEAEKIAQATGVRVRRVGRAGLCCSDLCLAACESLLKGLAWERGSIDALLFVSHSFDYPLPATSCLLQDRLGLPQSCAAFDVGLGCSGYIYGLWIGAGLIASGCKRVLVLAGEMASRMASPLDRMTVPLFGDAGTATALESGAGSPMHFELGTDGGGYRHLIVPAGTATARVPHSAQTLARARQADANIRCEEDLFMNGAEVFAFTLRQVPPLVSAVLKRSQWEREHVDFFFLHQANKFILVHLARRMGLPPEKVPIVLEHYGNTSSASIPLAMTHSARESLARRKLKLVLAGFGVGLSWGACAVESGPIVAPALVEVP
jgi:3-oxoacyl-[acyl-carrier-protein] synthase-3